MDMDEDEKEMLSEARARLANTKCAALCCSSLNTCDTLTCSRTGRGYCCSADVAASVAA